MMDTYPARGAKSWEATQIYAPYLLVHADTVWDFYNANSGSSEQSGIATLPLDEFPGLDPAGDHNPRWRRDPSNPVR